MKRRLHDLIDVDTGATTEEIYLRCRTHGCIEHRVHVAGVVDIAEFLRCAIGSGWRRIEDEPVHAAQGADGVTTIVLFGTCERCDRRQPSSLLTRIVHFFLGTARAESFLKTS